MARGRVSSSETTTQNKTVTIRFRVTPAEFEKMIVAANKTANHLLTEVEKLGLPPSAVDTIRSPSEWARYIVLQRAGWDYDYEMRMREDAEKKAAKAALKEKKEK